MLEGTRLNSAAQMPFGPALDALRPLLEGRAGSELQPALGVAGNVAAGRLRQDGSRPAVTAGQALGCRRFSHRQNPSTSRAGLAHVRWLGGATGAGKTTLASHLAARFGLHAYSTDAAIAVHGADPGPDAPLLSAFREMSTDERWLRRDAQTMLETFPWFAGERFERVVRDLLAGPQAPPMLAEGFRLLPRLVQPLLDQPWQALWLTTTPDFRRRAFERRPEASQFWRRSSDPAGSLERLLERDAQFADQVAREAQDLGLKVVMVDGTRPEPVLVAEVAKWFRL